MSTEALQVDFNAAIPLYRKQAEFVANPGMFSLFVGGVGSGKTVALTARVLYKMLANPGVRGALLGRTGKDIDVVLDTALRKHLADLQDATGINWIRDTNKARGELTLINGASVLLRPYTQVDKLAGLSLGWVCADEIAWCQGLDEDRLWQVLTGRVRVHCPSPSIDFASSPNGNRGIVAKFVEAQQRGDSRFWITTATSLDNPFLPAFYLSGLETMSKRAYAQEVLGKILRPLSGVYDLTTEHFIDWRWQDHTNFPFVGGWDIGGDGHHICLLFQVVTDPTYVDGRELAPGTWVCCDELIGDEMPRARYRATLLQWLREHGAHRVPYIVYDRAVPNEGQILQGQLPDTWVKSLDHKHDQYIENGIELVRDQLDPVDGRPRILFANSLSKLDPPQGKTAGIVSAMRNYRYMLDMNRNPTTKPWKDNTHDHAADALRMAVVGTKDAEEVLGGVVLSQRNLGPTGNHADGKSGNLIPHY